MLTLVFDTETTGMADFKTKSLHVQPYLVQLGAILFDDRKLVAAVNMLAEPDFKGERMAIPQGATKVHGITDDHVNRCAFPYKVIVPIFNQLVKRADRMVAHNMNYDFLIMRATYSRVALDQDALLGISKVCTMQSATQVLKLPGKYGFKWPSLDEAYRHFVDKDGFDGAHDAMEDVKAASGVLWGLEDGKHKLRYN